MLRPQELLRGCQRVRAMTGNESGPRCTRHWIPRGLANKVLRNHTEGENCRICIRRANLRTFYRRRLDVGFQ